MGNDTGGTEINNTDSPSVLFLAPGRPEAETLDVALSRHGLLVTIEYDFTQILDGLATSDVECLVVSDTFSSISREEVLEEIRERDSRLPVVFLLSETNDDFTDRLDSSDIADYVTGDVESISYGRLADRIRALVATYRTLQARHTEREITERLEDRLHQTEQKITALHSVAMKLNTTSTADEVYRETVAAAENILDLDICFAFAAEDGTFVPKAQSSTLTDRKLRPVSLDSGVMGETYRTGESTRVVDMELHALADPEFGDYQSGISVPIGEFGVFQAVSEEAGAFDEIELELTELLAADAASVLQRLSFEQELRHERDRYAALFRNSSDCILEAELVNGDAIIRRVNPAFEEGFGYDESDIVGCDADDVIVPEGKYENARNLTNQVSDGDIVQAEVRRQTSDGVRDFLLRSVPVDDDTLYAVYTDITEQKEKERTIEQQKERLDKFASTVSHDLRNPLNVAQSRLELAREMQDNEHLEAVHRAHVRIETLIEDILILAREGEQARDTEPVRLTTVVTAAWDVVATADASLTIETECTVHADEGQLQQLVENLLRNAIDHGGEDVSVTVGECNGGFYVADDGPGIPPEDREAVFEAGYSTGARGTGLGLSIVEQVVDAHDWQLSVTGASDGGTRFEITDVTIE